MPLVRISHRSGLSEADRQALSDGSFGHGEAQYVR